MSTCAPETTALAESYSLEQWKPPKYQKPPAITPGTLIKIILRSFWYQGIRADYRKQWWKFLLQLLRRWALVPMKLWWGCALLTSGHHFITYAAEVVGHLNSELRRAKASAKEAAAA